MTQLPARTAVSDTYPLPSNATARTGFGTIWDSINEALQAGEVHVASASTIDVGNQESTRLYITGTTGITSFGTTYRSPILLRFAGALTITHNATTLRCPGGANITTAAGDVLIAWPTAASSSGAADGWQVAILARGTGPDIPSGTVMAFFQANAPTGWTKVTTHNNKAIRIVSGTGGGSGGSQPFTTAFASQSVSGSVGYHNLTIAEMPPITVTIPAYLTSGGGSFLSRGGSGSSPQNMSANSFGGGDGHNHTFTGTAINLAVQYIDMILASKN